ncbi:MAG TPA: DsbA family protein [Acidimicrobiales bacterium]|nr:DsbA family protein [Acidimicrobiales bacterium]
MTSSRPSFAVTWDYRCPFARIGHDHILTGLADGADWDVSFKAFSLDQTHVEEGGAPVWEAPDRYPGVTANLAGIAVRDGQPEQFQAVHRALFEARHQEALDLRDRSIIGKVLDRVGVDGAGVLAEVDSGRPLEALRDEHTWAIDEHQIFGVPTFVADGRSVFVRLMRRPEDGAAARRTVERIVDMIVGWPELNEFKHTSLSN